MSHDLSSLTNQAGGSPKLRPLQELTDSVDPQDPEEQEVVLLTQELVPEEDHQPGAREETCWTPHGEPQHCTTHTHPDTHTQMLLTCCRYYFLAPSCLLSYLDSERPCSALTWTSLSRTCSRAASWRTSVSL